MQWMEGCKISDAEGLRAAKLRPRDVGNVLLDAFARMQYVEGWIHGDAHSGNLLVRPAQHQRKRPVIYCCVTPDNAQFRCNRGT